MSITNFIERGNPEDMDDEKVVEKLHTSSKTPATKSKISQNYLIVAIILLTALASLGLGFLEGANEKGTSSAGLVVSSVPMSHAATNSNGGEVVGNSVTK
jgi:hypothetical protein